MQPEGKERIGHHRADRVSTRDLEEQLATLANEYAEARDLASPVGRAGLLHILNGQLRFEAVGRDRDVAEEEQEVVGGEAGLHHP